MIAPSEPRVLRLQQWKEFKYGDQWSVLGND